VLLHRQLQLPRPRGPVPWLPRLRLVRAGERMVE
jgi:hypothetical protein